MVVTAPTSTGGTSAEVRAFIECENSDFLLLYPGRQLPRETHTHRRMQVIGINRPRKSNWTDDLEIEGGGGLNLETVKNNNAYVRRVAKR